MTLADFQSLIRRMYLEKDIARGVEGTFMWLMEEVGELASALTKRHPRRAGRGIRRRAGLADHYRQRGRGRSDRGGNAKIRVRLPGLRPVRVHLSGCGKTMSRRDIQIANCKLQIANCKLHREWAGGSGQWVVNSSHRETASGFIIRHSSLILHPSSFILHPSSFLLSRSCFSLTAPVLAENIQPPEIVGVRVGIGERCKVGLWTPVEITLQGGSESLSGTVTVTVPDGDGIPSRVFTPPDKPCQVLPGRQTTVPLYARIGQVTSEMKVEYIVEGRVAARKFLDSSIKADQDHFIYPLEAQPLVVSVGPKCTGD